MRSARGKAPRGAIYGGQVAHFGPVGSFPATNAGHPPAGSAAGETDQVASQLGVAFCGVEIELG